MVEPVTASMLYDLVACERRCHHDLHTDPEARDPQSEFVRMLWTCGHEHEAEVFAALGEVENLCDAPLDHRFADTLSAMSGPADVILGARLEHGDVVGMPDVLRRIDGIWVAGDVKLGGAHEADGRRPRLQYAVQVALYAHLLGVLNLGRNDSAFVIGSDGVPVTYDLAAPWGRDGRSLMEMTTALLARAKRIRDEGEGTLGAMAAQCKMCHWHTVCEGELVSNDDLTLIAGVGRAVRDALAPVAPTVAALADLDIVAMTLPGGRTTVSGMGAGRLGRFRDRARLLRTPGAVPYARCDLGLARRKRELHYDVEADPSRAGLVYCHGIWERTLGDPGSDRYVCFFADRPEDEREAFAEAFDYLTADPEALVVYYSKYERTSMRALQDRHPGVCSPEDIEALFRPGRAIDLLGDVVMPNTEWPTRNLSIKTLARWLGFEWSDVDASGSNSIAWFDSYCRTRDPAIRRRIEIYNRDDVIASAVLFDGLIALPVSDGPAWSRDS